MGKIKALKIRPDTNEVIKSKPHWTGVNKVWWVIMNNGEEIGKGSNPSNVWRSAYRMLQK